MDALNRPGRRLYGSGLGFRRWGWAVRASFLLLTTWSHVCDSATYVPTSISPPKPPREFRAAWIATVGNIDWPSAPGLTTAQQQAELIRLLDGAVALRLNAIMFQVRPACDALYASRYEPWSEYLTGAMGRPPDPSWDPLTFAIQEAHKRGLEFHAWFNPYRARHVNAKSPISADHISRRKPSLVRKYGSSLWLDPGEKEVQDYSLNVVMDVVRRYDIDGVHFDDYFYPYPEKDASGKVIPFPDTASWKNYGAGSGLSRDDWRRENVNTFIQRCNTSIRTAKPHVKFGVSPFGIWRPGNPPEVKGKDAYTELHADSRKWLQKGWVDYLAPQLYWRIESPGQSFPLLLRWWTEQNSQNRYIWPGLNSYKVSEDWPPSEIVKQINITRSLGTQGHIHYNLRRGLLAQNGLGSALQQQSYPKPALVPAFAWKGRMHQVAPQLSVTREKTGLRIVWTAGQRMDRSSWVLETRSAGRWTTRVLGRQTTGFLLPGKAPEVIALTPVDRFGNLGPPAAVKLQK